MLTQIFEFCGRQTWCGCSLFYTTAAQCALNLTKHKVNTHSSFLCPAFIGLWQEMLLIWSDLFFHSSIFRGWFLRVVFRVVCNDLNCKICYAIWIVKRLLFRLNKLNVISVGSFLQTNILLLIVLQWSILQRVRACVVKRLNHYLSEE
jgi:hypothetical protein